MAPLGLLYHNSPPSMIQATIVEILPLFNISILPVRSGACEIVKG